MQDLFDDGAVAEVQRRAGGVDRQLLGEVARQRCLVGGEQSFERANIRESSAIGKECVSRKFDPVLRFLHLQETNNDTICLHHHFDYIFVLPRL